MIKKFSSRETTNHISACFISTNYQSVSISYSKIKTLKSLIKYENNFISKIVFNERHLGFECSGTVGGC